MKILIVDDIKENLYLLEVLLKGSGYEVVTAEDGVEALQKIKKETIDLIISDVLMPRMDGFQLCKECKKDDSINRIPFIFYTATYIDIKDGEFALSLGAAKFILKPQEPETFLKILKEVIKEHKEEVFIAPKELIKEDEGIYFEKYNKRLIQKLEKKMLDLEKANKILQEKEEIIYHLNQFQGNIIHNANIWINALDEKGSVTLWNEAAEKISGYSAAEVIGHDKIWQWLYPDEKYRKEIFAKANAIIEKGEVLQDYETRIYSKDGKVKNISWHARNLTNLQGKIIGKVAVSRDITEKKQAEEKLQDSEEYLKILFDYAPDAYYVNELKGNFIDGNKAAEKLTGYKREELIGESFLKLKLLSLTDIPKAAKLLVKNLRGQPTGPDELVLNRKDNTKVTVEISTYPIKIKRRTLVLGIARDITERRQAEESLKESEIKFRSIFDNATDGILLADLEKHKFYSANKTICQMLGYKQEEILNLDTKDIHPREYLPHVIEQFEKQTRKEITLAKDIPVKRKDGSFFYADVNSKPITLAGKTYLLGIFRDITERKQAEEKLKKIMDASIETMSSIIEAKDPYTAGHQQRVSQLTTAIAKELNLSQDKIEGIRIASLIHDIGKIGLPTEILSKPIKLSDIEFSLIKEHPQIGYDILKSNDFSYPVAQIILQHHERLDGSGYPHHLKGDKISLEACIIGVADVVEAMSSHRPYRPALGIEKALEEISQNKGILYDPKVVDICLNLFKEKGFKFE